jgi:integrase
MSLYRRGSIWWIELTSHGRRIRESSGTTDKKQAQEYHEKRKGEIWRQAKLGESPPVTWGEAVKKWMSIQSRGLPDRYRIARFGFSLTEALPLSAESVTKQLSGNSTGGSAGSWNRSLALIVAIHNAAGVEPPKVERRPMPPGRTRWLTEEEWLRLHGALEAESPVLAAAAEFSVATGLRENNVLNLEWSQVDLRGRRMWLEAPDTKGKAPLGVPLNDAACAVLEARRGTHKQYVFPNPDTGKPYYKASNRGWYAALKKAKLYKRVPGSSRLEVCWHTLRHTWASWHRMNGTALDELQDLGGWKDPKMVRRYAHLSTEHLAEAAARVKPVSLRYNAPKAAKPDTKSPTKGR